MHAYERFAVTLHHQRAWGARSHRLHLAHPVRHQQFGHAQQAQLTRLSTLPIRFSVTLWKTNGRRPARTAFFLQAWPCLLQERYHLSNRGAFSLPVVATSNSLFILHNSLPQEPLVDPITHANRRAAPRSSLQVSMSNFVLLQLRASQWMELN